MDAIIVVATVDEVPLVKQLGYENFPIVITGVGAINVISTLKSFSRNTHIINIGYAGSNNIDVGRKVAISAVKTLHEQVEFNEDSKYCILPNREYTDIAPCYTSTDFVINTKIKEDCVFDMELAFICSMFDNVQSIKIISDNLNVNQYEKTILRGNNNGKQKI